MRFVRLATTYAEQNLEIYQYDNDIYFRTCQPIGPKQELMVGYGLEYARTYNLAHLEPDAHELLAVYEKTHQWPCYECDEKFKTSDELQFHLNVHDTDRIPIASTEVNAGDGSGTTTARKKRKRTVRRFRLSQRKMSGPTVRYACCYCSEVFPKFSNLKRHNEQAHSFVDAEARNGSVLTNSNRQNANKSFKCDVCIRYFSSAERLEEHRNLHSASLAMDPKLVQCTYCPERMLTPSALAMHIKSHLHKNKMFICLFCAKSFRMATELTAHVPMHLSGDGSYDCSHCHKVSVCVLLIGNDLMWLIY